jgi:phosphatidylglycerophosphate synthase
MSIRNQLQQGIYRVINPFVRLLIRAGLTPNMVTTIGLVLNIGVAIIFIEGAEKGNRGDLSYVGWAGALILFAGLFDMLDGQVARLGNMSSRFGALYDSVLDRYSELILFLGICYYLVAHHYFLSSLVAFIGMIGSLMVSYTRARAEGLGIECKDGLMQRPERVILIGVSALACGIASKWMGGNYKVHVPHSSFPIFETISIFTLPLTVMAVLANATAIGRLRDAKKALEEQEQAQQANKPNADAPAKKASMFLWLLLLLSAAASTAHAQKQKVGVTVTPVNAAAVDSFPVPPHRSNSLFYLQRTPNINTIICELNEKNGAPDPEDPVHVLWIRYTEQRQRQELNWIQRHFAYGIKSQPLGNGAYELHFVSYKKIAMYLRKSPVDNLHHVYVTIGNKQILLNRVFIKINPGGTFWSPNVEYLEFKGVDPDSGKELLERVKI